MSLVAEIHPFVVGVDTHARQHVYTILTPTGMLIDTRDFPTSPAGINRALAWVARRTQAHADTLWVIEGAGSYGALLTGTVAAHGYPVAEAPWIEAKRHHGRGKSDTLEPAASPQLSWLCQCRDYVARGSITECAKRCRS